MCIRDSLHAFKAFDPHLHAFIPGHAHFRNVHPNSVEGKFMANLNDIPVETFIPKTAAAASQSSFVAPKISQPHPESGVRNSFKRMPDSEPRRRPVLPADLQPQTYTRSLQVRNLSVDARGRELSFVPETVNNRDHRDRSLNSRRSAANILNFRSEASPDASTVVSVRNLNTSISGLAHHHNPITNPVPNNIQNPYVLKEYRKLTNLFDTKTPTAPNTHTNLSPNPTTYNLPQFIRSKDTRPMYFVSLYFTFTSLDIASCFLLLFGFNDYALQIYIYIFKAIRMARNFETLYNLRPTCLKRIIRKRNFPSNQNACLLYTSPSPRDGLLSRMPSSA
eukprot:TRINITY_DN9569_c0_g1_i1.p1 TRINITY_DN9569_c0_g1~~TRINITY_DN9569_c0_g1_i1.p1  ORF type:complete len:335 (+),score=33.12 TRINITY_DN9569_c0_g1_i1:64-1068(+)